MRLLCRNRMDASWGTSRLCAHFLQRLPGFNWARALPFQKQYYLRETRPENGPGAVCLLSFPSLIPFKWISLSHLCVFYEVLQKCLLVFLLSDFRLLRATGRSRPTGRRLILLEKIGLSSVFAGVSSIGCLTFESDKRPGSLPATPHSTNNLIRFHRHLALRRTSNVCSSIFRR